MKGEQMLARQIALSISLATAAGNGDDLDEAITLAEFAIREAMQEAVLEEREACAKVCELFASRERDHICAHMTEEVCVDCANAIRNRQ
jgi:hypothetical protein